MLKTITSFILCTLVIYSAHSQSIKARLSGHTANVETVCWSADGKLIASGSWDGTIHIYNFDSSGNPALKEVLKGHLSAVTSLCFSANSKYLVSSSKDYSSRIWNIDTPTLNKSYNLHLEPVTASFLDPSNKYLVSASLDGTVKTTSIKDNKSKSIKMSGPVYDIQLSRDRKFYLVAVKGGKVKKYETGGNNSEVLELAGHTDDVNAIDISPDGNFVATASSDKSIGIWDLTSGKRIKTLSGFDWKVTSVKYSSDGKYIIGGCNNGVAKLFEVETAKHVSDFSEAGKNVRDVVFSRDGKSILVASLTDDQKFGAILYNSGVTSQIPNGNKGSKAKADASAAAAPKRKTNGTK